MNLNEITKGVYKNKSSGGEHKLREALKKSEYLATWI